MEKHKERVNRPRTIKKTYVESRLKPSRKWLDEHLDLLQRNEKKHCLERDSFILESVPFSTYVRLAPIFGLDPLRKPRSDDTNRCKLLGLQDDDKKVDDFIHLVSQELGILSEASEDQQVEVGTWRGSEKCKSKKDGKENQYLKFLKRTSSEGEEMTSLGRRSKELTTSIINEFLDWYKSIGGEDEQTTIDESALQEIFQIGFDSQTSRAIAVSIKEMPLVPETLAELCNEPEFAIGVGLKKLVKKDIKMEEMPPKLFAFGRMLPTEPPPLRFYPPKNYIKKTWKECARVPSSLDSMKIVWEGIENLRSTVAFSNWLKNHPEIPPPTYLKEKGLLDVNYEEWMQIFKGFEVEIESEGVDGDVKMKSIDHMASAPGTISSSRSFKSNFNELVGSNIILGHKSSLSWKA